MYRDVILSYIPTSIHHVHRVGHAHRVARARGIVCPYHGSFGVARSLQVGGRVEVTNVTESFGTGIRSDNRYETLCFY